jgi:peptidoglycan/LPS O-acetylase OafA/YrhL
MRLIGEMVVEGLFGGVAEAIAELPPRVRNTLTALAGLCLAGAVGATMVAWPVAENRPMWTTGLVVISLLYGSILGVVSGLTLANDRHERAFALFALLGCLAAAALPLVSIAT